MHRRLILLGCALLAGCVATGTKVTEEQLGAFQRGLTTCPEIVTVLGKPTQSTLHSDGSKELVYSYTQSQVKPINYVPILAAFARGETAETTTVALLCDPRQVLVSYTATSGQSTIGYGLSSGAKQ